MPIFPKDFMAPTKSARRGWVNSDVSMSGKTVLITGANNGIGLETAIGLAKRRARVIIACRNLAKAEDARYKIVQETAHTEVVVKQLDLSSFESIKELARDVNENEERLDVLINNAGIESAFASIPLDLKGLLVKSYRETNEGHEMHFGVNHLGHFLLTNLLLDLLKRSSPSRIVNVSSIAHKATRVNWDDINMKTNFNGLTAYSQSKLMNILFTRELSKRLTGTGVTANSLHPGGVNTDVFREVDGCCQLGGCFGCIMYSFLNGCSCFLVSPEKGAQTSIYCAIAPELDEVTGKYFDECKVKTAASAARNDKDAERLWNLSQQLTGIEAC